MAEIVIPNGFGNAVMTLSNSGASAPMTFTHGYENSEERAAPVIAEEIYGHFTEVGGPFVASAMDVGWTFEGVYVLQRGATGLLTSATYEVPIAGTDTADAGNQPGYSPMVVSKATALAGRAYRGRMYPPMTRTSESSVSVIGVIDSGALALIRAQWQAVFFDWDAAISKPVLLHSDPLLDPTPVTAWNVRNVVGTQRRRKAR